MTMDVRQFDDQRCCLSRDELVDSLNTTVTPTTSDLVVKETLELDEHTPIPAFPYVKGF
jgi:hypothetical protein